MLKLVISLMGRLCMCGLPVFMLTLPSQPSHKCNPCRQVIQFYKFSGVMCQAAACSQAVDSGDTHSSGGISVGCATATHILNLKTQRAACFPARLHHALVCR